MILEKPSYYDRFSCLCGACPDTCCSCWEISVDPEHLDYYQKLEGKLGESVRKLLQRDADGEMILSFPQGNCPMLTEEGLCSLQKNLGESALTRVCAFYPRFRYEFGSRTQLGLSISCPEVARLVLSEDFAITEEQNTDPPSLNDIDADCYFAILKGKAKVLQILSDRQTPLSERISTILLYSEGLERTLDPEFSPAAVPCGKAKKDDLSRLLSVFQRMEFLREEDRAIVNSPAAALRWDETAAERLFSYYINKYFLQAAYDGKVLWRAAFSVASLLAIFSCSQGESDLISTAERFSRETEHSEENLSLFARVFTRKKISLLLRLLSEIQA